MRYVLPFKNLSLGDDVDVGAKYLVYALQCGVGAYRERSAVCAPFLPFGEGSENFQCQEWGIR